MPSRRFVVNEWLLADLGGRNGGRARQEACDFLKKIQQRPGLIVFQQGTPWAKKAYRLMKKTTAQARYASKLLHAILADSTCCVRIEPAAAPLLDERAAAGIPHKDLYLVEMYLKASAHLLVTTDQPLVQALAHQPSLQVQAQLRADFLESY